MIKLKDLLPECNECGRNWNHGQDHEAGMAKNELKDVISNAFKIDQMIGEGDNLPGWVSAYISLTTDHMHSVAEYLAGESSRMQEPGPGYNEVMYESVNLEKVHAVDNALSNLKRNITTNLNIPKLDKQGLLRALAEIQEFVDEVGYDLEVRSNLNEGVQIATTYQFTPEQLKMLKQYGAKINPQTQELLIPETLKLEIDKHEASSSFKQDFYGLTVDPERKVIASQVLSALKKAIADTKGSVTIGQSKYYVVKGHITKNGNFNFPNPFRTAALKETDKKPSSGLTKVQKSTVSKQAHAGKDIGHKGKGFEKIAKTAEKKYGSKEAGEKVAAATMWKNIKRK